MQKTDEEGSFHYKNRRSKKGENTKNNACISNKVEGGRTPYLQL
jgi:hypothetical protein